MGTGNSICKRCIICGELMENVRPNRKYCDACRKDIQEEFFAKTDRRKKAVRKKEETGILAVVRKAEEEGLSYGHYVSKHNL